jgi:hypothetical protein
LTITSNLLSQLSQPTLGPKEATTLWLDGPEKWNLWIGQHPKHNVSFAGVDFSDIRENSKNLSFSGYYFGDGIVLFSRVKFGDGGVDFSNATYGNNFVFFDQAQFGRGDADFSDVNFGNCQVSFKDTEFDRTFLSFRRAAMRDLIFSPSNYGTGRINASGINVKGHATFRFGPNCRSLRALSFRGAQFKDLLSLSGNLNFVPDLLGARSSGQISISSLKVTPRRVWNRSAWPPQLSRQSPPPVEAAEKLQRLKEIAESNKDHQSALRFSADENRARRWNTTSWWGSVLDLIFSMLSNYGQSVFRPFAWFLVNLLGFTGLYKFLSTKSDIELLPAFRFALSNSFPFLPKLPSTQIQAFEEIFNAGPCLLVDIAIIFQGIVSFALLFLIGLGLRNRFRL